MSGRKGGSSGNIRVKRPPSWLDPGTWAVPRRASPPWAAKGALAPGEASAGWEAKRPRLGHGGRAPGRLNPAVHIELTRSGGFAGISRHVSVESADLAPEEAAQIEQALHDLGATGGEVPGSRPGGGVDRFQYDPAGPLRRLLDDLLTRTT